MSDAFWNNLPTLIIAFGTFVASVVAALSSLRNNKNIQAIHTATNSMKDDLIRTTGEAEHAKGVIQGANAERATPMQEMPKERPRFWDG